MIGVWVMVLGNFQVVDDDVRGETNCCSDVLILNDRYQVQK